MKILHKKNKGKSQLRCWGLGLLVLLLAFASCKDDFDINKLQDVPRLVVYCFPSARDTTVIIVSKSLPVASTKGDSYELVKTPVDARIGYQVNGKSYEVRRIEEKLPSGIYTGPDSISGLVGQYYVVAPQKAGDQIQLEVAADDMEPVSASTSIPLPADVVVDTVFLGSYYYSKSRMEATVHDDGSAKNYYAVASAYSYHQKGNAIGGSQNPPLSGYDWNTASSYEEYLLNQNRYKYWDFRTWLRRSYFPMSVDVSNEPLFAKHSQLDDDFGFDDYTYYGNLYIFDDKLINGKSYTLHLDLNLGYYDDINYNAWDPMFGSEYDLCIYSLTPEYYRFLSSMNNANSNGWSNVGLMQVTPTYTNVKGGFGIVAGYYAFEASKYISPSPLKEQE